MGAVRIAILAAAAVAAILLAFIVRGMMTPAQAPEAAAPIAEARPMAQVLVAKEDLPIGTRLSAALVSWQPWPVEALNPTFITDGQTPAAPAEGADKVAEKASQVAASALGAGPLQAIEGAIVREPIAQGEPISAGKIVRGGEGGYMSVVLEPGMRAVAVPVSQETAAGGFILPGDRVDVLQSYRPPGEDREVTETLLRNVRVLAIDQTTTPEKDANSIVGTVVTIEAPADDAELLALGRSRGEMVLALRSYADLAGPVGRGAANAPQTVRIYRNGEVTEESVR